MHAKTTRPEPRSSRSARPTALAVLQQMLKVIKRRGWARYSFEDIRDGRASWWLADAKGWSVDLNGAAELAHREVFGHPQVPAIYRFWTPISQAINAVIDAPLQRWEFAPGRTHDEVVAAIEAAIAYLEANPPRAERKAPAGHKVGASSITKADVLQRLSLSPAFPEIRFDGVQIGTWKAETKRELIMGTFCNVRRCTATIPTFCGLRVVKEAKTFAAMKDAVAVSLAGILQRHPDRKVA